MAVPSARKMARDEMRDWHVMFYANRLTCICFIGKGNDNKDKVDGGKTKTVTTETEVARHR